MFIICYTHITKCRRKFMISSTVNYNYKDKTPTYDPAKGHNSNFDLDPLYFPQKLPLDGH